MKIEIAPNAFVYSIQNILTNRTQLRKEYSLLSVIIRIQVELSHTYSDQDRLKSNTKAWVGEAEDAFCAHFIGL